MENKKLTSLLQDALEEQVPASQIDLLPGIQSRLVAGRKSLRQQGETMNMIRTKRLALTALAVIAVFTLALITPQGRAWAQEVFQFFRRVSFTTIPLSQEEQERMNTSVEQYSLPLVPVFIPTPNPEMAALSACQAPHTIQSYSCQVAYAEARLGMDLMEFPKTPEGWIFKSLNFDVNSKIASFVYSHYTEHGGDLILKQGTGKYQSEYWERVPAEKVETVKVGPFSGEYVLGEFTLKQGDNAWRWDAQFENQRLAWSDGARWYYMEINPPSPGYIDRDQFVDLAERLVNSPHEEASPLNPDSLASIAEAESYSGLDLKAPTLLPLGYEFSYARYFPFNREVHLHYKYGEDLVIYEWKGHPDDFKALANIYKDHELVEVNGKPAFYGVPQAVSQYESSYLFLAWHDEDLNYRLHFYFDPTWGGGMLDKQKMIAIAKSMDDINDYKRNQHNSYEYLDIYEKALDFAAKEFSKTPEGWLFTDVHAYPDCITLSYSAKQETGEMIVSQCKINEVLFPTDIPPDAVEQVNIGKKAGEYIRGNLDYDKNGEMVWNLDAHLRQVRWQEGSLWIQIVLSGDSTVLYDKEDLISYAESLR